MHPLLFPALLILLGVAFALCPSIELLLPLLFTLYLAPKKRWFFFLFILSFCYGKFHSPFFIQTASSVEGIATFKVIEIQEKHSYKHKQLQAKAILSLITEEKQTCAKNLPVFISLNSINDLKHSHYTIEGTLEKKEQHFIFKPKEATAWQSSGIPLCLPKLRLQCKLFLTKQIAKLYSNTTVCHFLTALTLGQLQDPLLRFSFSKLGLQHILAISGFHFAILSLCLGFTLHLFLPKKIAIYSLMLLLTLYFLLLGFAPSVLRSYLAAILYLIGSLLGIRPRAINLLSATLILELLICPTSLLSLGFKLSFLATAAIIFLCPLIMPWTQKLLPKRSIEESLSLSITEKPLYLICAALRPIITVNLAVLLAILPTSLYQFSIFPLSSLLYNLFVPLCVTLSLCLFLLALPLFFLPWIGDFLHHCNQAFTKKLLDVLIQSPPSLDYTLSFSSFPLIVLYAYLLALLVICLIKNGLD